MRAGNIRNKAMVQNIGTTQNAFGEIEEGAFVDFKPVWCSIIPITPSKANEMFVANTDFSKATHTIKIRYTDGINASQRLVWRSRAFNFLSIINVGERDKEIHILAEEEVNGN